MLWEEELEVFKEDFFAGCFAEVHYLDTWYYEYEFSHNEIEENRKAFIKNANEFLTAQKSPYTMREVCENAMVCDLDGNIVRRKRS